VLRRARPLLGTYVDVAACAPTPEAEWAAVDAAFAAVARVHRLMSFHDPESDLARINRRAHAEPVAVAPETFAVLERAAFFSEASDGLFDCTVGAALVRAGRLPGPARAPHAGGSWRDVELLSGGRIRFRRPLTIDLGGIAKGYAVDAAIEALVRHGAQSACVNAGGDLRAAGPRAWPIAVRSPRSRTRAVPMPALRDGAVATTACAGGPGASRVADPRTGRIRRASCSVSVYAPRCIDADALTKIVWLGAAPPTALLERLGARAVEIAPPARTRAADAAS
jgi:thiamine biosynthesis lipoprotein